MMSGQLSRRQLLWLGIGTAGASGASRLAAASVAKNSPTDTVATGTQDEPDLQSLTAASFGARGDGNIDDTTALQAAVNAAALSGRDLSLGRGIYLIRADVLSLKSGVRIKGEAGTTLLVKEVEPSTTAILKGHKVEDILIEGVMFVAPSDSIWALDFSSSRRIRILRNVAKNCALIRCSAGPERSYDSITEADCCSEVTVSDNILHGPPKRLANGGIHLRHTLRAAVLRNHVRRHGHGIWWWGGDAGKIADEGSPRSPCWVRDVLIADNDIAEISSHAPYSGGGIWGSKGQRVAVLRNKVADCSDIEIDFEGCLDSRAMENVIHSTTSNASLAIFFFCSGIRLSGNHVVRANGGRIFGIFNSSQQFGETGECVIEGNKFKSHEAIGVFGANSAFSAVIVTRNTFENVRVERSDYSVVQHEYTWNRLIFTIASDTPFDGLYSKAGGSMAERRTINKVVGNTVASLASQTPGSRAIVVEDDDFNVDTSPQIDLNVTFGFANDVYYLASSANAIAKTALIRNNVVQHSITLSEKKASKGKSSVIFDNNRKSNGRLLSLPRSEYEGSD